MSAASRGTGFKVVDRRWVAEAGLQEELRQPAAAVGRPAGERAPEETTFKVVDRRRVAMTREQIAQLGARRSRGWLRSPVLRWGIAVALAAAVGAGVLVGRSALERRPAQDRVSASRGSR